VEQGGRKVIHEFKSPVEVVTPLGDGYLFYVQTGGTWGNDIFTVVLRAGGDIRHFRSDQIQMWSNGTWDITKKVGLNSAQK
jgi:hypothetical protein